MNRILKKMGVWLATGFIAICGLLTIYPSSAYADPAGEETTTSTIKDSACEGVQWALTGQKDGSCDETYKIESVWGWIHTIINYVLIVVGIVAVVFIIIGGVRFQTSAGEPDKVKSAKNTLMFSIIGLVIAILAGVIVQIVFNVVGTVTKPATTSITTKA